MAYKVGTLVGNPRENNHLARIMPRWIFKYVWCVSVPRSYKALIAIAICNEWGFSWINQGSFLRDFRPTYLPTLQWVSIYLFQIHLHCTHIFTLSINAILYCHQGIFGWKAMGWRAFTIELFTSGRYSNHCFKNDRELFVLVGLTCPVLMSGNSSKSICRCTCTKCNSRKFNIWT